MKTNFFIDTVCQMFGKNHLYVSLFIGIGALLAGCSTTLPSARSNGEQESGFTYVPLDPFAVEFKPGNQLPDWSTQGSQSNLVALTAAMNSNSNILQSLPDNAVRIATEQFNADGNVSYGPASASVGGNSYKITVDFISSDTVNLKIYVEKFVYYHTNSSYSSNQHKTNANYSSSQYADDVSSQYVDPGQTPPFGYPLGYIPNSETYRVIRIPDSLASTNDAALRDFISPGNGTNLYGYFYNVPIYIGIGLRVTADISTFRSGINISGLGTIGAATGSTNLTGTLVVQTLGVNGKSISAALPIQSELNQTTAQNAIVAVGAIKALLYEPDTVITPRVVGMYIPFSGSKSLVNAIISQISQGGVNWSVRSLK